METSERIELVYPAVFADVREAVRIRMRALLWWRLLRWAAWGAFVLTLLASGVALLPPTPDPGAVVKLVALGLVAVVAAELAPWLTARAFFQAVRSQGEATAVVDEDGARWTSRDTEMAFRWALMPRYVETPRLFVLLTAEKSGSGFAYLPKRGLAGPGEEDRLRAVLDRNISKV
ncbi:YcxB family protein [Streptomyces sp. NBC_00094]|uniref:YcxB family protein n=1 Tax=Streptomyces sp. NBC_00094 TaxID=2903620 RepID=UPI002256EE13|nr:YcxB family protein [Streptomyces sp. NBC_00094]MCX5390608.1 YcxB family protein [Streptomyces sp. NBC_00094]